MNISVLASGSAGNCYIISDDATNLMIECGIPFQEIQHKTNFFEEGIAGCLISHSHKDHLGCAEELMKRGIDCYMSDHTFTNSGIDEDVLLSRARIMEHGKEFDIGTFTIRPLKMNHDVPCLGFLIYSKLFKESLFFATDTYYIQYIIPAVDYIMIETNYDLDILNERIQAGDVDMVGKNRLIKSHMSIDTAIRWLTTTNLAKCRRIFLMHLSDGSSNEEEFKRRVIEATGIPCTVC